jgi:hypothetical protein
MRAAAMRPVEGPPGIDAQAASGGLELPGGERHRSTNPVLGMNSAETHEPIPGEHDASTLTHRQPGAMGGAFNGADNGSGNVDVALTDAERREFIREGGGRDAERLFDRKKDQKGDR